MVSTSLAHQRWGTAAILNPWSQPKGGLLLWGPDINTSLHSN
jgi:hypothetical protein